MSTYYESKNLKEFSTLEDAINYHIEQGYHIGKFDTAGNVSMVRYINSYNDPIAALDDNLPSDVVNIIKQ